MEAGTAKEAHVKSNFKYWAMTDEKIAEEAPKDKKPKEEKKQKKEKKISLFSKEMRALLMENVDQNTSFTAVKKYFTGYDYIYKSIVFGVDAKGEGNG